MTNSPSNPPRAPGCELDLFLGTGAWSEVTTDREGYRCVEQQQQSQGQEPWQVSTLRAYFADGALAAMTLTDPAGGVTEMPAATIAHMAAMVQARMQDGTPGTPRRSTRSR